MEIHNGNFEDCFPIVANAIEEASFVAFDTEFTGLDDGSHITGLDTPEKRYFKLLKPAKDYLIIQFGLSVFKKVPGHSKYIVESFNFSIFPRTTRFTPDVTLKFQGPSLEFITYQGIDFDEIIKKGIPYLSTESERKLRGDLRQKHSTEWEELNAEGHGCHSQTYAVPHWRKEFIEKQIKLVEAALQHGKEERMTLGPCDLLSKFIIFGHLESRFSNQLVLDADATGGSDSIVIRVTFVRGADNKRMVLERKQKEELEELRRVFGFTRIVQLLHESNKLLVGHNMLLDVMHTLSQFWESLPQDYSSFKGLVHSVFPRILDTKHMASMEPFKAMTNNRNLRELYDELKINKKISSFILEIPEGFPDYMSQSSYHNAAYDAFVTGICYLLMKSYLAAVQKNVRIEDKLTPFENKLYLMRIVDVPYMDLSGEDLPLTSREHIFHIQFYRNKSISDLKNLFAPFGDVDVKFIDDNSAFVCMLDREKSHLANKKLSSGTKEAWYKLQPLSEWYSSRNEGCHPGHGNTVTREGPLKRKHIDDYDHDGFGTEVTQENFEESFLEISNAVDEATFLAFSTAALGFDPERHLSPYDTPEARYRELLEPIKSHVIVQFGLCAFRKVPGQNKYEAKSFNVSVYPRSSKLAPDVYFASENSELEKDLVRGIRVGKIINEGVTYLSESNEKSLCDKLVSKQHMSGGRDRKEANKDNHNSCPSTIVPVSKQEFVDKQIKSVEAVLTSRSSDSVTLEPCNSFIRKLLYEQLNFRFPDQLFIETTSTESSSPLIRVTFVDNPEHRRELEARKQDQKLEDLHRALGFTRIIKLLHKSDKLIVGHDLMHRVMHVANQFWSQLPTDYQSFKTLACHIFPRLLDTRHMVSTEPFKGLIKSRDLCGLHEELKSLKKTKPNVVVEIPPEFPSTANAERRNSALEAYEAGVCFLLMKFHLGNLQKNVPVEEKVVSYENKLHLAGLEDVPFVNLRGDDLPLSRDHMFHVQFRKSKDLLAAMNILLQLGTLRLMDDTSAIISVSNKEKLSSVKRELSSLKDSWYRMQPLTDWRLAGNQGLPVGTGTAVLAESPPNLKRKRAGDLKDMGKKLPAKRKQKLSSDGSPNKNNEGIIDPLRMFHVEPQKTKGVVKPPLFEVPDDWD